MKTPQQIIKESFDKLESKYSDVTSKIDNEIDKIIFTGGKIKIVLDIEFIKECTPIIILIYGNRGWKNINVFTEPHIERIPSRDIKVLHTVIEMEYVSTSP